MFLSVEPGMWLIVAISILSVMTTGAIAQEATYYPPRLYPGVNVVTITNPRGIDRITARSSRRTTVDVPSLNGCPTKVDVRITVNSSATGEEVDFTLFDCDGHFASQTLQSMENWTILHERTGRVELGRDTCLRCRIESSDDRIVDSIVVRDPRFTVRMPSPRGPWRVEGGIPFNYQVCYRPTRVDTTTEMIRLYIRRDYASGGLTNYVIEKPITAVGVLPPEPKPVVRNEPQLPALPPLEDPTTFRNIVMPTAEPVEKGKFFLGTYDLAGWLAGYGATDRLTVIGGGAFVPEFIGRVAVGTIGGKYELVRTDQLRLAAGFQYGYSSTAESNISASTPFAVISYGDRRNRISLAAGYSWKHHTTPQESFERNASIVAIGGDFTIARGWKLAAETYMIESSGLAPLALTARYFTERFALDFGFGIDLSGGNDVRSTGTLSGEIRDLRIAPILSAIWVW
jgi:hypothetical protein